MATRRRPAKKSKPTRRRRSGRGRWIALVLGVGVVFALGWYLGGGRLRPGAPPVEPPAAGDDAGATEPAEPYAALADAERRGREQGAPAGAVPSPAEPTPEPPADAVAIGVAGASGDEVVAADAPRGRIALVIDDLGRSLADLDRLAGLGIPIGYAVLPFESMTPQVAATLRKRGVELMVHLPMEAENGADPGPGALRSGMSAAELRAATERALAAVPGAVGVNNHMGSVLSADPRAMQVVLGVLAERSLFFLDSRTSPSSVGYRLAREMGLPTAERQVFLDADPAIDGVRAEWARLLELASARGAAIAIGHPHPRTLSVLEEVVPAARAAGYGFVPVSYLLEREGGLE